MQADHVGAVHLQAVGGYDVPSTSFDFNNIAHMNEHTSARAPNVGNGPLPNITAAAPPQQSQGGIHPSSPPTSKSFLSNFVHPIAGVFHVAFKICAIVIYLVGFFVSGSYVGVFIACALLVAADFWTVKNVTGRLLVGLRWWNQIQEDGASAWHFESLNDPSRLSDFEGYYFWFVLGVNVLIWAAFSVFSVFSFKWLPLSLLALVLGTSNFIGYFKCRRDAKKKLSSMMMGAAMATAANMHKM